MVERSNDTPDQPAESPATNAGDDRDEPGEAPAVPDVRNDRVEDAGEPAEG